jgi:hypothetical protein
MNLPGYRQDDPHDESRLDYPERFQFWADEKDEARAVLSIRATLVRGAGLIALLLLLVWAL